MAHVCERVESLHMLLLLFFGVYIALCGAHLHSPSNEEHYVDGEHNTEYDKEAFLGGEEESDEFANLSPEERMERLKNIIRKIDTNSDGSLTEDELSSWIQKSFKHYTAEEAKLLFADYDKDGDGLISWEEYNFQMYDRMVVFDENTVLEDEEEESFRQIFLKDKKRFDRADRDGVPGLNLTEFTDFEHPEDTEYMSDFVIEGALEEHDKDGDGFVDLDEFLGDYNRDPDTQEDPEWILIEKDRFVHDYDKDHDGKLNPLELLSWITSHNQGIAQEEAFHLIEEMDRDGDKKLSETEVLENYELFLSSDATDYGRQLHDEHFYHEEL